VAGIWQAAILLVAIGAGNILWQPGELLWPPSDYLAAIDPAAAVGAGSGQPEPPATPLTLSAITDPYQLVPLTLGRRWIYDLTWDYLADGRTPARRQGQFSVTITAVTEQADASVFVAELDGHPLLSNRDEQRRYYVVLDDRLYELRDSTDLADLVRERGQGFEDRQVAAFPLVVGQRWGLPADLARGNRWVWQLEGVDDVTTPAGTFSGCAQMLMVTNPDWVRRWLCPGVGLTRYEYHHNGSLHDEAWELRSIDVVPLAEQ
jgi:hypothetical protein